MLRQLLLFFCGHSAALTPRMSSRISVVLGLLSSVWFGIWVDSPSGTQSEQTRSRKLEQATAENLGA